MKLPRGKHAALPLLGVVVVLTFAFGFWRSSQPWIPEGWTAPLAPPPALAQTTPSDIELHGWGWSDNIGWLSFNSNDTTSTFSYAVKLNPTTGSLSGYANLSGYAWSNNIGWVQFDPLGPYPSAGPNYSARMENGKLTGWARAISPRELPGSDGWDGWIKLGRTSGEPDYGITVDTDGRSLKGYSWGSTVVGWLQFGLDIGDTTVCPKGGVCLPQPTSESYSCAPSPSSASVGTSVTWSVTPAPSTPMDYQWKNGSTPVSSNPSFTTTVSAGTYNISVILTNHVTGVPVNPQPLPCPLTVQGQRNVRVSVVYDGVSAGVVTGNGSLSSIQNCSPASGVCAQSLVTVGSTGVLTITGNPAGSTVTSSEASCVGTSCAVTVPSGTGEYLVTITIHASPIACPTAVMCVRAGQGVACNNPNLSLNTTNNNRLTSPTAELAIVGGDGHSSIKLNFSDVTVQQCNTGDISGQTVNGLHRFSQSSSMSNPAILGNNDSYSVTTANGKVYYKLELPTDAFGDDTRFLCLANGVKQITGTVVTTGCSDVHFSIPFNYASPEVIQ